jgi:[ribosomal protein S5]-alanine N-acetyltransferase
MEFILQSCKLRSWQLDDAKEVAKQANNENIARNLRDGFPYPYRIKHARFWIKSVLKDTQNINLAIELDGKVVGSIGFFPFDDVYRLSGEIGYWLAEPHWGKGIVTEAVTVLTDYIFQHSDIVRIQAEVFQQNPASARVLEKAGYKREATLEKSVVKSGVLMDAWMYVKLKGQEKNKKEDTLHDAFFTQRGAKDLRREREEIDGIESSVLF